MQTLEPCGTEDVTILAIESSCDETAAAVVRNGREVLSNIIFSQIDLHTIYGGVVPEIASRKHIEKINQVIEEALVGGGCDPGGDHGDRGDVRTGACRGAPCRRLGGKSDQFCRAETAGRRASH